MDEQRRTRVVILGGGTAGWMTAAALARLLPASAAVHLIESTEIGIVGVGEATIPHMRAFVEALGLDEAAFMRATSATFKLGIAFEDFGRPGERYVHPFGAFGREAGGVPFHHYWARARAAGYPRPLSDFSLPIAAGHAGRFAPPRGAPGSLSAGYNYAYHFDSSRFGPHLRAFAEPIGVRRTEGKVVAIERDPASGNVAAATLEDGRRIEGDLFVDCSGFRSLLLGRAMEEPWEDWSHWLPCDRAVAAPCAAASATIEPFTRAIAMPAGWRWRIPLRHRVGNGHVYSSAHCSDQEAADALMAALEGEPLADPRVLRFRAGRRRRSWVGNVVGIGLSSGFLEPLESTSLYLAQMAITGLIELFPAGGRIEAADRDAFNRLVDAEHDRVRDFLILHYHVTTRRGSPFWDHVRAMAVPDSLAERIELFRRSGRVARHEQGLFLEPSWVAALVGQGVIPEAWDQRADRIEPEALVAGLERLRGEIAQAALALPDHADFIARRDAGAMAA